MRRKRIKIRWAGDQQDLKVGKICQVGAIPVAMMSRRFRSVRDKIMHKVHKCMIVRGQGAMCILYRRSVLIHDLGTSPSRSLEEAAAAAESRLIHDLRLIRT